MDATNKLSTPPFDRLSLGLALASLAIRLEANQSPPLDLVVCGGSALIMTGLLARTTQDVDVVALIRHGHLCAPDPLPPELARAVQEVAEDLNLPPTWLNNGPSRGAGGLFQMGLPAGFVERLHQTAYGNCLTVHFIHRLDQIHFKLYAAADRGGYHITDLRALAPSVDELLAAARWAMTHDVSEGFAMIVKNLLRNLGHDDVASQI